MPYIDKYQRGLYVELLSEIRDHPIWRSEEDMTKHDVLLGMLFEWIRAKNKENPLKMDGDVNFLCTRRLKYTQQTFRLKDGKKIYNSLNKDAAEFVRDLLTNIFEGSHQSYSSYERLYGLLSLMEAEFERRGWSTGRKDLKAFFIKEKAYWRKRIAEYEDKKIQENGDV
jgi:hypothetical protein